MASHIRHGFGAVRAYIYGDASTLALIEALGGEVLEALESKGGAHVEARIEDSMVVVETKTDWPATQRRSAIYVYVPDVDAAHAAAVAKGARSVVAPETKSYGERTCTLQDAYGNTWYLATALA